MEYMNIIHDTIKFICNHSDTEIAFLGILVIIDPDTRKPYTTLYSKLTDL